jgi:hypothetical protein
MNRNRFISIILLFLTVGCSKSQPTQIEPGMITSTFTPENVGSQNITEMPVTPTPLRATPTELPATMTEPATAEQDRCLEMTSASMSEIPSSKGLVLFDRRKGNVYLWKGTGDTLTPLPLKPGGRAVDPSVSLDHQFILYDDAGVGNTWNLVIANSIGEIVWTKTYNPAEGLYGWFDGQRLWYSAVGGEDTPGKFFLIDPFRGTQEVLRADLPGVEGKIDYRWHMPITVYDPSLTRVIYAGCDERCSAISGNVVKGWPVFLYDVETNKVMGSILTQDHFGATPIWLPDGSAFIMAADLSSMADTSQEFFSMSRDGVLKQMTHLRDEFSETEISKNYTMSPDGHYLAFWLRVKPGSTTDGSLAVIDLRKGSVTDYCLTGYSYNSPALDALPEPIWSPDGSQIAIMSRNSQTPGSSRIAIIDLPHGTAVQFIEMNDVTPVGWVAIP